MVERLAEYFQVSERVVRRHRELARRAGDN
jgi:UPF0042 nucleotide-binding protein